MLEAAFVAGLSSEGVEVIRLGVAPTAAIAFEAARLGAMGAVVSASHNPYEDNGIKLFAVGGTKLPDELEQRIEQALGALPAPAGEPGAIHGRRDLGDYVDHLLACARGPRPRADCASWSTPPTVPRRTSPATCSVVPARRSS